MSRLLSTPARPTADLSAIHDDSPSPGQQNKENIFATPKKINNSFNIENQKSDLKASEMVTEFIRKLDTSIAQRRDEIRSIQSRSGMKKKSRLTSSVKKFIEQPVNGEYSQDGLGLFAKDEESESYALDSSKLLQISLLSTKSTKKTPGKHLYPSEESLLSALQDSLDGSQESLLDIHIEEDEDGEHSRDSLDGHHTALETNISPETTRSNTSMHSTSQSQRMAWRNNEADDADTSADTLPLNEEDMQAIRRAYQATVNTHSIQHSIYQETQQQYEAIVQQKEEELLRTRQDRDRLFEERVNLQEEGSAIRGELSCVREQLFKKSAQLTELQTKKHALKGQLRDLEKRLQVTDQQYQLLQEEHQESVQRNTKLEAEKTSLSQAYFELLQNEESLKEQLHELMIRAKEDDTKLYLLETQLVDLEQENHSLHDTTVEQQKEVEQLRDLVDHLHQQQSLSVTNGSSANHNSSSGDNNTNSNVHKVITVKFIEAEGQNNDRKKASASSQGYGSCLTLVAILQLIIWVLLIVCAYLYLHLLALDPSNLDVVKNYRITA